MRNVMYCLLLVINVYVDIFESLMFLSKSVSQSDQMVFFVAKGFHDPV